MLKNKNLKKAIAVIMTIAVLMSMSVNVFAEDGDNIIQINGVELKEETHIVSVADLYHALGGEAIAEYANEVFPANGYYTLTSSKLIEMFSFSTYQEKTTTWNQLRGSKVDVSILNGIISIHSNRRIESVLRDRSFTVQDSQIAGYVGYRGNFVLTTKFLFTDNPVMFKVSNATKQVLKNGPWLIPVYTTDSFEIDPPSSASTGARWVYTVNGNEQYTLATYSYQE